MLLANRLHFPASLAARYGHMTRFWPMRIKWECPGMGRGVPSFGPPSTQQPGKQTGWQTSSSQLRLWGEGTHALEGRAMSWQEPGPLMTCVAFIPALVYQHLAIFHGKEKYTFILFNHCRIESCCSMQSNLTRTGVTGRTYEEERTTCVKARGVIGLWDQFERTTWYWVTA